MQLRQLLEEEYRTLDDFQRGDKVQFYGSVVLLVTTAYQRVRILY